jgi:hypothetical protein
MTLDCYDNAVTRYRLLLTLILCIALLAVRVGGAHLHLCLDGQEPASAVHVGGDSLIHDQLENGPAHQDYDVDLISNPLGKFAKVDFSLFALILAVTLLLLTGRRTEPVLQQVFLRAFTPPARLRPPSCGPPLISFA